MRIIALVKSHDHVCCRYRIAAFRPAWEAQGHTVEIRPWSQSWLLSQLLPGMGTPADLLIVQRKLFPAWQWNLLRKVARQIIFDFDDAIYLHSSNHPAGVACPGRFRQFRQIMQTADIVVAGNETLRDQAASLTDLEKVRLIPTCVNVARYGVADHSPGKRVKMAWIGSSSTLRGLERTREMLEGLGNCAAGLELRVICDRSLELTRLRVEYRDWSEATETADLAGADIGISWLPDDRWSEGKCGLKVLQYMAAGLPVVANPVGVQAKFVVPGETGFLASSVSEWHAAVSRLASDPELRRRMGQAGRRRVEAEYRVERGIALWNRVLNSVEASLSPRSEPSFA